MLLKIVILLTVFSTYVEVIPGLIADASPPNCILHVCGGDPNFPHQNY